MQWYLGGLTIYMGIDIPKDKFDTTELVLSILFREFYLSSEPFTGVFLTVDISWQYNDIYYRFSDSPFDYLSPAV